MVSFETARDVFAVIGVGFCLWQILARIGRGLGWIERAEIERQSAEAAAERQGRAAPRPPQAAPAPAGVPPEHVAAIAAAVAAMGGGLRLVMIDDPSTGQAWAAEGRWLHQTSHRAH